MVSASCLSLGASKAWFNGKLASPGIANWSNAVFRSAWLKSPRSVRSPSPMIVLTILEIYQEALRDALSQHLSFPSRVLSFPSTRSKIRCHRSEVGPRVLLFQNSEKRYLLGIEKGPHQGDRRTRYQGQPPDPMCWEVEEGECRLDLGFEYEEVGEQSCLPRIR